MPAEAIYVASSDLSHQRLKPIVNY
jgi:hypothetical protein